MNHTKAMKQALEALESNHEEITYDWPLVEKNRHAITTLRTAIEQAEKQELVAWMDALKDAFFEGFTSVETYNDTLLNSAEEAWAKYEPPTTAPAAQPAVPLTDEQILDAYSACSVDIACHITDLYQFARAIEAAHGITGEKNA